MPTAAVLLLFLVLVAVLACLVSLIVLPQALRWAWLTMRTRSRLSKGLSIDCGYNLTGLTEPRCPECGTGFAANEKRDGPQNDPPR